MDDVLYLVHRIPFPPNKGDKIRSFHILKHLAERYSVHLGTFVDDPIDNQYIQELVPFVASKQVLPLSSKARRLASIKGLLNGKPLSEVYYECQPMQEWVDSTIHRYSIKKCLVFSSQMAQFVIGHRQLKRVMDFVDVDSEKWFQYAQKKPFPFNWVYAREGRTLRTLESRVNDDFDGSLFVSEQEAELFRQKISSNRERVQAMSNGVDMSYFDPDFDNTAPVSPYKEEAKDAKILVFTGAMDYWANIEAVQWFCDEIFPAVREKVSEARFYIVGARPADSVLSLMNQKGVVVTGSVKDVRPYLKYATVAVAPLRIARGIQNKVLEALSMEKIVVATPEALEGIIHQENGQSVALTAPNKSEYIRLLVDQLNASDRIINSFARQYVQQHFSWQSHLSLLETLL